MQFADIDKNGDGEIDFEEMMSYFVNDSCDLGTNIEKVSKLKNDLYFKEDKTLQEKMT